MPAARLIVGLGGALAGDDAVGLELARRVAADPRLPPDTEVLEGGPDLLRLAPALLGREHVVLVDAVAGRPGEKDPVVQEHPLTDADDRQGHAHQLSAVQALDLLRLLEPALAAVRFTWFLVPVTTIRPSPELSPELAARLAALVNALLAQL